MYYKLFHLEALKVSQGFPLYSILPRTQQKNKLRKKEVDKQRKQLRMYDMNIKFIFKKR
jgi:hypothetical protein